jgi:glucose/arabinose dehydrogenase
MASVRAITSLPAAKVAALLLATLVVAGCEEDPNDPDTWPVVPEASRLMTEQVGSTAFEAPVDVVAVPGTTDMLIVEQAGRVLRMDLAAPDAEPQVVVEIPGRVLGPEAGRELGLFSVALHPTYPSDPRAYLSFTASSPTDPAISRVLEVPVRPDGRMDPDAGRVVFELPQPRKTHNGGTVRFLPDGRLGIAMGDGGYQEEHSPNAQDPDSAYGALVAIDVDADVDPDGELPALEVLAIGFRNPWKWSIDPETEQIWLGDVGLRTAEEINRVVLGGNHGWPRYEGTSMREDAALCSSCGPLVDPVVSYGRGGSRAVIGGEVYRGSLLPALWGVHIFAGNESGLLMGVDADAEGTNPPTVVGETLLRIVGFGVDQQGELYVLDRNGGGLHRLVPERPVPEVPALLSQTGFVDADDPEEPPDAALEYPVQWPFFADGADKRRWLLMPDDAQIEVRSDGDLTLPVEAVLVKTFARAERVFETRAMVRSSQGGWRGYSYRWRADGTDADLLDGSELDDIEGEPWLFPGRVTCLTCHSEAAGVSLGPTLAQLGGPEGDAVQALIARGWLDSADVQDAGTPPLPSPDDPAASLDARARAYLDTNCSMCHRPTGTAAGLMDLRFDTAEEDTGLCSPPALEDFGFEDPRIVAPGEPERSVLIARMAAEDDVQMNPYRQVLDADGLELLTEWVRDVGCR